MHCSRYEKLESFEMHYALHIQAIWIIEFFFWWYMHCNEVLLASDNSHYLWTLQKKTHYSKYINYKTAQFASKKKKTLQ